MHICPVEVLILKHNRSNTERRVLTLRPNVLHPEFSELKPRRAKRAPAAVATISLLITDALEDAKADNIVSIDVTGKTSFGDIMIVASGRSQRHVGAIADRLIERLKEEGVRDTRVEGIPLCDWVLIDAGDVIVHIFRPEVREFYNLEKMWGSERPKREAGE